MTIAALAALLLAAAAPSYAKPDGMNPMWEYPVYSSGTAALIASWRRVAPDEEPDDLSDGDWFCLCQDWQRLRARVTGRELLGPNRASLRVHVDLGSGQTRNLRMIFVRERGRWKLDDLFATREFPRGLKQALRETIAADTKK
jgi:hypothetical protein